VVRLLVVSPGGCLENPLLPGVEGVDAVLALGDFVCPTSVEALEALRAPLLFVTGRLDDTHVVRLLEAHGLLLDGRVAEAGGVRFAGVGGREPLANTRRLNGLDGFEVLASYHPVHGVFDSSPLGLRRGLWELLPLLRDVHTHVAIYGSSCSEPGTRLEDGILHICPGRLLEGCYAVVEVNREGASALVRCR